MGCARHYGGKADPVILLLFIPLYFLPSIVAIARKAPDTGSVIVLNFFLGWTFVGWVLSLAMAARSSNAAAINVNVHQQLQPHPQAQPGFGYGYGGYGQIAGAQPYQLPAQRPGSGHIPMPNGQVPHGHVPHSQIPASNGHGQATPQPGG
jgi:hypothetical protein